MRCHALMLRAFSCLIACAVAAMILSAGYAATLTLQVGQCAEVW